MLRDAAYVLLIALCLSDFRQRTKANYSRLLFIAILLVILFIL